MFSTQAMDLFKCWLRLLLALVCGACALALPTIDKTKIAGLLPEKPSFLQNPTELLSSLSAKLAKPKPVFVKPVFVKPAFVKPVLVKPIVVVKPILVGAGGGGGGGGGGHGHGHGHGHHGKNKFISKLKF